MLMSIALKAENISQLEVRNKYTHCANSKDIKSNIQQVLLDDFIEARTHVSLEAVAEQRYAAQMEIRFFRVDTNKVRVFRTEIRVNQPECNELPFALKLWFERSYNDLKLEWNFTDVSQPDLEELKSDRSTETPLKLSNLSRKLKLKPFLGLQVSLGQTQIDFENITGAGALVLGVELKFTRLWFLDISLRGNLDLPRNFTGETGLVRHFAQRLSLDLSPGLQSGNFQIAVPIEAGLYFWQISNSTLTLSDFSWTILSGICVKWFFKPDLALTLDSRISLRRPVYQFEQSNIATTLLYHSLGLEILF